MSHPLCHLSYRDSSDLRRNNLHIEYCTIWIPIFKMYGIQKIPILGSLMYRTILTSWKVTWLVRPFKIWTSISLEIRFFLNLGVWYSDSYGIFIYLSNVNFGIMFFFRKNYFDKDPREDEENLHKSGFSNQDKEM